MRRAALGVAVWSMCACAGRSGRGDGLDAATPDAGASDTGAAMDAGALSDAGAPDGPPEPGPDAGPSDAGATDAGPFDAAADAPPPDAGTDAGPFDASLDAGLPDTGVPDVPRASGLVVFVTALPAFDGNLGGLPGADATCTARAAAAGLSGTFKAWLSLSGGESPSTRFTHGGPYVRPDGVVIADDWADLTDGTLDARITQTETGEVVDRGNVWTATEANGTPRGSFDCRDWTTSFPAENGIIGNFLYDDTRWTALGAMACMDRVYRLYCFEQ